MDGSQLGFLRPLLLLHELLLQSLPLPPLLLKLG
jgi:hypothetical protein